MAHEYAPETIAVTATAAALSVSLERPSVSPEVLLLALAQDCGVRALWPRGTTLDAELSAYERTQPPEPAQEKDGGWSPPWYCVCPDWPLRASSEHFFNRLDMKHF